MTHNIIITVPKLTAAGGVSAFWNALLPQFSQFRDFNVTTLEVGGHGKNFLGPLLDQLKFNKSVGPNTDLVVLNPSLGARSFFRDGLFARRLVKKNKDFIVFFHGWDLAFEKKISDKYIRFFQSSFGRAERILVLSPAFKDKLVEWGFKGDIIVETTTVDKDLLSDFSPENKWKATEKPEPLSILFLSRLLKEKGIYEVIDAFKKLQFKFSELRLIIAGDGEEFQAVARAIKSVPNIEMMGHVDGKLKVDLLGKSHIYCLPSYSEGLPTSVLEAMAFALPVVTTAVGGLQYFFEDQKMGYFVDLEKEGDLEQKLASLILDTQLRTKIGNYNHGYAEEKLLSNVVAKRLYHYFLHTINHPDS